MQFSFVLLVCLACVVVAEPQRKAPYVHRGWKPSGPAFELPSEKEGKSLEEVVEVKVENTDSLREYGPPEVDEQVSPVEEVQPEEVAEVVPTAVSSAPTIQIEDSSFVSSVDGQSGQVVATSNVESKTVVEDESAEIVQDLEQQLKVLANMIKAEQVANNAAEEVIDAVSSVEAVEASLPKEQAPVAFTEYGPPKSEPRASAAEQVPVGFTEYGPPTLRSSSSNQLTVGFTEYGPPPISAEGARFRRFSPRLRFRTRH